MYYQLFLEALSQLSSKGTASLALENGTIYIQSLLDHNKWRISTPLFTGNGYIPEPVLSCVSSGGNLHWQKAGAYLQLEDSTQTISLIDEMEIKTDKYLSFKNHMSAFIELSQ